MWFFVDCKLGFSLSAWQLHKARHKMQITNKLIIFSFDPPPKKCSFNRSYTEKCKLLLFSHKISIGNGKAQVVPKWNPRFVKFKFRATKRAYCFKQKSDSLRLLIVLCGNVILSIFQFCQYQK